MAVSLKFFFSITCLVRSCLLSDLWYQWADNSKLPAHFYLFFVDKTLHLHILELSRTFAASLILSYTVFYVQSLEITVFTSLSKRLKNKPYYYTNIYWQIREYEAVWMGRSGDGDIMWYERLADGGESWYTSQWTTRLLLR